MNFFDGFLAIAGGAGRTGALQKGTLDTQNP